jgi:hypothetical protein
MRSLPVHGLIQRYLFLHRQFFLPAAAVRSKTKVAAVIAAPLAE